MEIFINQNPRTVADNSSLYKVLSNLDETHKTGIAVAINDRIIPSDNWSEMRLSDQDKITIIIASQGGLCRIVPS